MLPQNNSASKSDKEQYPTGEHLSEAGAQLAEWIKNTPGVVHYPSDEYWSKVRAVLHGMLMPELINAYRAQVREVQRLSPWSDKNNILLQVGVHKSYAAEALEELRRRGLPKDIYDNCRLAWQFSDVDWGRAQQQIEAWVMAELEHGKPKQAAGDATMGRGEKKKGWIVAASLLVKDNPNMTDIEIAQRVGKHPKTLAKSKKYRRMRDGIRNYERESRGRPAGSKDKDGNIDAYENG